MKEVQEFINFLNKETELNSGSTNTEQGLQSPTKRYKFSGYLEHRFIKKNLTPQPPSLPGKGEKEFSSLVGKGLPIVMNFLKSVPFVNKLTHHKT
jgi:hypothetical protein